MFELPEVVVLARQLAAEVAGRRVTRCVPGNSPHKFVFYDPAGPEYAARALGKVAGAAAGRGKFIFLPFEPGYVATFGEFGGRLQLHAAGARLPDKYHVLLELDDGRTLTAMTQMWGFFGMLTPEEVAAHKYAGGIGIGPADPGFTAEYFAQLVREYPDASKQSVKGLLTQHGTVAGIGNSYAQDIMWRARLGPRRRLTELADEDVQRLYEATVGVVRQAIELGGRNDEVDLYGQAGRYERIMDRHAAGKPCPACGAVVEKMQYLGGACYVCPGCQR